MGGRGSGGGRSGGGGGASSQQDHEVKLRSLNEIYQEKYSQMTDSELNRALTNAKNLMNKEQANVLHEQQKLEKMVNEFKKMKDTDPGVDEKWNAIDKQTGVLNDALFFLLRTFHLLILQLMLHFFHLILLILLLFL